MVAFLALAAAVLSAAAVAWRRIVHVIHSDVLQALALSPGMSVLDLGCGGGRLTVRLARAVGSAGRVLGVDVDPRAVRAATTRARRAGLRNVAVVLAAADRTAFASESFDRAVLVAVLGEIPDRSAVLAGIFRALKPGGLLAVTEVALDPHRRGVEEVRRLAEAAGFDEAGRVRGSLSWTLLFRRAAVS